MCLDRLTTAPLGPRLDAHRLIQEFHVITYLTDYCAVCDLIVCRLCGTYVVCAREYDSRELVSRVVVCARAEGDCVLLAAGGSVDRFLPGRRSHRSSERDA